jgi:hypothetical protein
MRENVIIELTNGMKYIVVDMIEMNSNKYFLLSQTSKDETKISDKFDICRYDNDNNNFDYIENVDEYTQIKNLFDQRIEKHRIEFEIISKIDFDNLIKLEVLNVRKYEYKLKYNNKVIQKNIEFYSKTKPIKGDYIYMSISTLNEDMLSYGHIHSLDNISHTNILVIEKGNQKIYLQRYYG